MGIYGIPGEMRKLGIEATQRRVQIDKERAAVKQAHKDYSEDKYAELMLYWEEERQKLERETNRKIDELIEKYLKEKKADVTLYGADITADAELFKSDIAFTHEELEEMFAKYNGNYTMQRIILDYANKNSIRLYSADLPNIDIYKAIAERMKNAVISMMQRPQFLEELSSEAMWESLLKETDQTNLSAEVNAWHHK